MAAASALLALALAGPPLYVSSATSEALQTSIAAACPSDAGVLLHVTPATADDLDERAAGIDHVRAPVHTEVAGIRVRGDDSTAPAYIVWRDGMTSTAAGSIAEPPAGEVAVPGSYAADADLRPGDRLDATASGETAPLRFDVAGIYPDIPVQPEPGYWCALRDILRPDGSGSDPAPVLLAARSTVGSAVAGAPTTLWELHPDAEHLTRSAANEVLDDLRAIVALAGEPADGTDALSPIAARTGPGLGRLIDDADDVGDTVARGLIGLRLVALAVATAFLVVAGAAVVRARQVEMRLRVSRGERPSAIALRIAERQALPALAGTVVGVVVAYAGVRAFGPAPEVESSAVIRAAILATVGLVVGLGVVATVGAVRADALVDHPRPRRRRLALPWEVVPLLLAAIAFARLDRAAGIRIVGTAGPGGDGLGDAFPAFALLALGAVLVRPLRWLFAHARRGGGRLSPALLLGWRRLGADPGRHAFLAAVVAAGVGATIVASSLGLTVDRMVHDKATTFLGADLRVVTAGEPVIPGRLEATPISRVAARAAGNDVQVIGIDPDTFAGAVHWRDDASDYSLGELLSVLDVDDMRGAPLPAIVVGGPVAARTLTGDDGVQIDINAVATVDFFPGKTSAPLVIVNRDALAADGVPSAAEIWLRDPPPDATRQLAAAGNLVRGSQGPDDVFDPGSVHAVRWADHALWAFAAFLAAAALAAALHIVGARRRERQAATALARQLGEPPHQELGATLLACGVPTLIGAVMGIAGGALTMRLLADQLDTVGNLPPGARIVYDLTPVAAAAGVAVVLVAAAAIVSHALVGRPNTAEVIAHVQPA